MFEELKGLIESVKETNRILPKLLWAVIIANVVNIVTLVVICIMVFRGVR